MFSRVYYALRYFAQRFFPQGGAAVPDVPGYLCITESAKGHIALVDAGRGSLVIVETAKGYIALADSALEC